jgi:hypothetical protein
MAFRPVHRAGYQPRLVADRAELPALMQHFSAHIPAI